MFGCVAAGYGGHGETRFGRLRFGPARRSGLGAVGRGEVRCGNVGLGGARRSRYG